MLTVRKVDLLKVLGEFKTLWSYVAIAFNRVDEDRLQRVGPDRCCAEWILKNGGAVRLLNMPNLLLKDYNALPPESVKFKIQVIDATSSSIMKIGFDHLKNCDMVKHIILHDCKHLEEDGLNGLVHVSNSLINLQVSRCYNLNDNSFNTIGDLKKLQNLVLFDLRFVKNLKTIQKSLQTKLPNCNIIVKE